MEEYLLIGKRMNTQHAMREGALFFLLFIAMSFCFGIVSCNKKEQPTTSYTMLEGKWKLIQTATDDNNSHQLDPSELVNVSDSNIEYYVFNKDTTGYESIDYKGVTTIYNFIWTFPTYDSLVLYMEGSNTVSFNILNFSTNSLTLQENTLPEMSWYIYTKQ